MAMRRFQMMIEPELYAALERRAAEEGPGVSVAELLRRFARAQVQPAPAEDPLLDDLYDGPLRGDEGVRIDDVIYGAQASPRR
ncbi:MAG: hypothetical protein M3276_01010 [Actinomycetota bacterium]|nr:hypothetical protein [Actinomycetota bacterium]